MSIWQAFLLAVVQGLSEFLPISSSGHLVLFHDWLRVSEEIVTFSVILHVGSALAILAFFAARIVKLVQTLWLPVIIGTLPAVLVGLFFKETIEALFTNVQLVSFALLITAGINLGIQLLLNKRTAAKAQVASSSHDSAEADPRSEDTVEPSVEDTTHTVRWWQGLVVGTLQACAITPGISRSGSTVFGGLLTGLPRKTAFEFSFLLALPAIGGATLLQLLDEIETVGFSWYSLFSVSHLVGLVTAIVVSYGSLWLLRYMMQKATFWWFSVYCFGIAVFGLLLS